MIGEVYEYRGLHYFMDGRSMQTYGPWDNKKKAQECQESYLNAQTKGIPLEFPHQPLRLTTGI